MSKKIKNEKIRMCAVKPGMVINTRWKKDTYGTCLVTACNGFVTVEYSHFNYSDAYIGIMIGTEDGETKVEVITGDKREEIINSIRNDLNKAYWDAKSNVDLLLLIKAMS